MHSLIKRIKVPLVGGFLFFTVLSGTCFGQQKKLSNYRLLSVTSGPLAAGDTLAVEHSFPFGQFLEYPWIDSLAQFIQQYPDQRYTLHYHTDDRGSEAANLVLAKGRLDFILKELENRGVRRERIETIALGESEPIFSSTYINQLKSEEEKERAHLANKRLLISLVSKDTKR